MANLLQILDQTYKQRKADMISALTPQLELLQQDIQMREQKQLKDEETFNTVRNIYASIGQDYTPVKGVNPENQLATALKLKRQYEIESDISKRLEEKTNKLAEINLKDELEKEKIDIRNKNEIEQIKLRSNLRIKEAEVRNKSNKVTANVKQKGVMAHQGIAGGLQMLLDNKKNYPDISERTPQQKQMITSINNLVKKTSEILNSGKPIPNHLRQQLISKKVVTAQDVKDYNEYIRVVKPKYIEQPKENKSVTINEDILGMGEKFLRK